MANVKGTVFESTRMFTEQQFGAGAYARVLAELSPEDRKQLADVQTLAWYPVDPIIRFHHVLDRMYGRGDLMVCVAAGKFSATWSMNTVLKVFLRFKSPSWLIDKATRVWDRYHDSGRWEVRSAGPHKITGELLDFAVRDEAFCARLRGWLQGAVEATGGKNAVVTETRCACRRHDRCAFEVVWDQNG